MSRYLLFDSSCGMCTDVARRVERLSGGWLAVRPLDDPELRSLVADMAWRPTLLVVEPDDVKVYVGASMAVRLVVGLGPRRAMRIASMVSGATTGAMAPGRRALLKGSGLGVLLGLSGITASASVGRDDVQVLRGDSLDSAVREALASPQAVTVVKRLPGWAYEARAVGAVALAGTSGSLVLAIYGRADRSPDRAGVLVVDTTQTGVVHVTFEEVQAELDELFHGGQLQPAALTTLRSWTGEGEDRVEPTGVREYMACMTACLIVGSCDNSILTCSRIPWLPGVLACIAAICGPQAYRCHNNLPWRCRRSW